MNNTKFKIVIFIILIVSLVLLTLYGIFGTSVSLLSVKEIKTSRTLKNDLINSLKINNVDAVYDKQNNIYYYTIPEKYENGIYILKLGLKKGYKYKLIDKEELKNISGNKNRI